jgi:hypothetical protein
VEPGPLNASTDPAIPVGSGVYRSRAVTISGWVDSVSGVALLLVGILVSVRSHGSNGGLTLGLVLVGLGVILGIAGAGRVVARLEVHETKIVWTWAFSRHEHSLDDLTDAALVEPGEPSSGLGASGAGMFLPLGFGVLGVFGLIGTFFSGFKAGPTLGTHTLIVIRKFGASVRIQAIGTFAINPERSTAALAEHALQAAIAAFHVRSGEHHA